MSKTQILTILELEGMYPDSPVEDAIFSAPPLHSYDIKFLRGNLGGGNGPLLPISGLSEELCASIDGLLVFRHYLTREDLVRFTNLKVSSENEIHSVETAETDQCLEPIRRS